ncbi:hypothetical protein [Bradyrhizobium sp. CB1015]|uniref:hypothetical protein n=1 Tax=Bradyrhizobium sp. CB1015 TaxID=2976822 RepID=UPI0021AAA555|nr:hypothetical protein [Bradyrhizobium sp. CB1015]UWU94193.1 hypothetical protein N2604_10205 [Bradyrhizobium sp. CB1015]
MRIPSDAPEKNATTELHPLAGRSAPARSGAASWTIILVLVLLLVATDFVAYVGWTLADGVEVSAAGYFAMAAGVLFSLIVGCGLMTLIFYSSRNGYDEPPVLIGSDASQKRINRPRIESQAMRTDRKLPLQDRG